MATPGTETARRTPARPDGRFALAGSISRWRESRRAARPGALKILHVHGRMARGGAELRNLEILRRIDRGQYRFAFCAFSGRGGELEDDIRSLGCEVFRMPQGLVGFSRRFRELLRRESFDVVHSHLHYGSGYLLRLAAQCGIPARVAHFRSSHHRPTSTRVRRLARWVLSFGTDRFADNGTLRRWIDRYATHVLGVSRWALESAWGPSWKSDPRCRVVYNGPELAPFAEKPDRRGVCHEFGLPQGVPLLIHVGRMAGPKNHLRLLGIFSDLLRHRPTARLLLVGQTANARGDNTIERRLRCRIVELGVGDRVVIAGQRPDVPRLLKAADALIFPSLWEGLPGVVLEARAAGTPVLASDLPGVREIADRLAGVRCLSLEEPDAAWAGLAASLADNPPSEGERRVALERFAAGEFTAEKCTEALCRIWRSSSGSPGQGGAADG